MLKSSQYSVTFPTNGQSFSGVFTFQPGVTIVTGRNGRGKTLGTIELWRYLLFGKKALRGPASDYRKLDAQGVFEIRGVEYSVLRNSRKETLLRGDEQIAVGAEAVNAKVVELMGFGLEVFDICNASVQKQSNHLSKLTPAKRKELIDEVVGLSQNEAIEKDCKGEAKLKKLEAETIRDNVTEPVKPTKPSGYKNSQILSRQITDTKRLILDRSNLLAIIDRVPTKPTAPATARMNLQWLEHHEERRATFDRKRLVLETQLRTIPTTTYTIEQVEAAEAVAEYDAEIARRGERPSMGRQEAEEGLAAWQHKFALEKFGQTEVICPECSAVFSPGVVEVQLQLSATVYAEQVNRHRAWEKPIKRPKGEAIPADELAKARIAIERAEERADLTAQLAQIPKCDDLSQDLATARVAEQLWWAYDHEQAEWEKARQAAQRAIQTLQALPPPMDLNWLEESFVKARIYEAQKERFETDRADYSEKIAKATKLMEEATSFTKGAQALADARREMKAHLAPSLSRIASSLISEMTCGKLDNVVVDEDMNIAVNGQDVGTLSGAGETAANLALRLALGRTLVGGVFPVFLGDEVDSDADEERSEAVFECLRNLRSQFSQVIIITHKPHVTADHVIDMDE